MKKIKRILLFFAFFFVLHAITGKTYAQFGASEPFGGSGTTGTTETTEEPYIPPTDPCNEPQNPDEPPVYCPIDGGLAFLLVIGAGYGVFINRSSQKKMM
ncbi:MAG TPA: hypothetical protein VGN63_22515 [Flavisolibacter sp.]|jgi:hypothetical protein|nr:hypothetical protein [Flavisolibacter sp.]